MSLFDPRVVQVLDQIKVLSMKVLSMGDDTDTNGIGDIDIDDDEGEDAGDEIMTISFLPTSIKYGGLKKITN